MPSILEVTYPRGAASPIRAGPARGSQGPACQTASESDTASLAGASRARGRGRPRPLGPRVRVAGDDARTWRPVQRVRLRFRAHGRAAPGPGRAATGKAACGGEGPRARWSAWAGPGEGCDWAVFRPTGRPAPDSDDSGPEAMSTYPGPGPVLSQ
jgi:hypothetical protein